MLDAVEAAASCAKADAERPASAATDPFDDFETASSSGSNSLLAAESFDRQMSDVVDRSLEESRVRYLNMAFTTLAKVPTYYYGTWGIPIVFLISFRFVSYFAGSCAYLDVSGSYSKGSLTQDFQIKVFFDE